MNITMDMKGYAVYISPDTKHYPTLDSNAGEWKWPSEPPRAIVCEPREVYMSLKQVVSPFEVQSPIMMATKTHFAVGGNGEAGVPQAELEAIVQQANEEIRKEPTRFCDFFVDVFGANPLSYVRHIVEDKLREQYPDVEVSEIFTELTMVNATLENMNQLWKDLSSTVSTPQTRGE